MILEQFDECKEAVVNPADFCQKIEGFPETCLCMFSHNMFDMFVEKFNPKGIGELDWNGVFPMYEVEIDGTRIVVNHLPLGAPAAAGNLENLIELGAKKFLVAGCAGCLSPEIEEFGVFIPTSAIRDEGTSYHYMPASDEIELDHDMVETVESFMKTTNVPFVMGKTWTTDAVYRETKAKVEKRRKSGLLWLKWSAPLLPPYAVFEE